MGPPADAPSRSHPSLPLALSTRSIVRLLIATVGLCAGAALPARAQWQAEAELGAGRVSQSQVPARSALTVQGNAAYQADWFGLHGATAVAMPPDDPVRTHALFGATARTSRARRVGIEAGAEGSVYQDGVFPATYAGFLAARVYAGTARVHAWAGAGTGALDDQVHRYPLTTADLGVATRWRWLQLSGTAAHHRTESEPRVELPEGRDTAVTLRDAITYTDFVLAPRAERGAFEVAARGGVRLVHRTIAFEPRVRRAYGSLDVAWWATPRVAVTASYGRELADLARGLPETRYVTIALRARLQGPERAQGAASASRRAVLGAAPDILVEHAAAGGATLRVLAASSVQRVEVAGTFSEWEPMALEPDGAGAWRLAARLPGGAHRLLVRVDGGAWQAPANLPTLVDEDLGARVGLVTVP